MRKCEPMINCIIKWKIVEYSPKKNGITYTCKALLIVSEFRREIVIPLFGDIFFTSCCIGYQKDNRKLFFLLFNYKLHFGSLFISSPFSDTIGSITNIDEDYKCSDGSTRPQNKKIWGVLGAASSATSIQVANLLRLFRIPQVSG